MTPVTRKNIPVRAQWALHGKVLDDEGYHVIACSQGDLSKANFADALGRFTLGALDTLPQVSVSYLQPATRSPGGGYLALAIHWFAADGQRYADGVLRFDNQGRRPRSPATSARRTRSWRRRASPTWTCTRRSAP